MSAKQSRRVIAQTIAVKLIAEPTRHDFWMQSLAAYLVEHKRVNEADLIVNDITHELLTQNGQLLATVTSARELTETIRAEVATLLRAQTGAATVVLSEKIDASLIGGVVIQTPDHVLDTSVRKTLQQLANINKRPN